MEVYNGKKNSKKESFRYFITHGFSNVFKAIKAGCDEIPIEDNKILKRNDAMQYAIEHTYTNIDLINAVKMLPRKKQKNGEGRAVEILAKKFGLSSSTIYQIKHVLKHSSKEAEQRLENGISTIKEEYKKCNPKKTKELFNENIIYDDKLIFLRDMIFLLILNNKEIAANILFNNFIGKNKRTEFYGFLFNNIKEILEKELTLLV